MCELCWHDNLWVVKTFNKSLDYSLIKGDQLKAPENILRLLTLSMAKMPSYDLCAYILSDEIELTCVGSPL